MEIIFSGKLKENYQKIYKDWGFEYGHLIYQYKKYHVEKGTRSSRFDLEINEN